MNVFKLNEQYYIIDKNLHLDELLKKVEFYNFNMNDWKELLFFKDGIISSKILRKILYDKIEKFDKSSNVNSFIYKEKEYWFDKNTRASLLALVSCSENTITLVLGDELIEIEVSKAKKFLSDLEIYASKCFVNTQKHLNAIKELKTVEDIINYDYTKGYPDKLKFDEYLDLA